jgi:hypothetical protein
VQVRVTEVRNGFLQVTGKSRFIPRHWNMGILTGARELPMSFLDAGQRF